MGRGNSNRISPVSFSFTEITFGLKILFDIAAAPVLSIRPYASKQSEFKERDRARLQGPFYVSEIHMSW